MTGTREGWREWKRRKAKKTFVELNKSINFAIPTKDNVLWKNWRGKKNKERIRPDNFDEVVNLEIDIRTFW